MKEGRISSCVPSELRWLSTQIRPLLPLHLASFLCITTGSLLGLLTPLMLKWIIDQILPNHRVELLLLATILILLGTQGKAALASLGSYLMLSAAQRMSLTLRMSLLRHLDSLSADYYESTPLGTIVYPMRDPIEEIAYFGSDLVPGILHTLLTSCVTLATMFVLSPALSLVVIPFIPMFLVTRQHFRKKLETNSDRAQSDRILWNNFLEEHVAAVLPIQLLRQQKRQERKGFRLLARTVRSQQKLFSTGVWFTLWTSLAVVLAMSAVIGYGGLRVLAGTLTLGGLVAFYSFVTQLFDPLSGAAELYSRTQKTLASVRQVQALLAVEPTIVNPTSAAVTALEGPPQVDFLSVEFRHHQRKQALRIPFLQIAPGERVAIAGENGAGKSTLVKLIARIYDVDLGSLRIGGEDVRNCGLEDLRQRVCYLPREPVLFDGSLAFNLRFVRPTASSAQLSAAIQCAGLSDFVRSLPEGLDQQVGPGACQLSGGERQRVAIARALLQKPQILILDEATSCLDPSSEAVVLRNIYSSLTGSTVLVISHRFSTLATFGRIIVLANGQIISDGGLDSGSLYGLSSQAPAIAK